MREGSLHGVGWVVRVWGRREGARPRGSKIVRAAREARLVWRVVKWGSGRWGGDRQSCVIGEEEGWPKGRSIITKRYLLARLPSLSRSRTSGTGRAERTMVQSSAVGRSIITKPLRSLLYTCVKRGHDQEHVFPFRDGVHACAFLRSRGSGKQTEE